MNKFKIDNFIQRAYIIDTYKKFFNKESDTNFQELCNLIYCYDIMEEKELETLEKRMNDVKDIIIKALHEFELKEINKTHKS